MPYSVEVELQTGDVLTLKSGCELVYVEWYEAWSCLYGNNLACSECRHGTGTHDPAIQREVLKKVDR